MDRTVGPREALSAGIIALGVLAIVVPLVAEQISETPATVVAGMSVMIGIFVIVAGIASFRIKD